MKIFCFESNQQQVPVWYLKPDTCLLRNNEPFFIPNISGDYHAVFSFVVRLNRIGKCIQKQFAHRYYDHIAAGVNFIPSTLRDELKDKNMPWDSALCYDKSLLISKFHPMDELKQIKLEINREEKALIVADEMWDKVDEGIEIISKHITLKIGDLICLGLPKFHSVKLNDKWIITDASENLIAKTEIR